MHPLVLIMLLAFVGFVWLVRSAPRNARPTTGLGYRIDARAWPGQMLEVMFSDGGHFVSRDGVRWFRHTPSRFDRVRGSLVQVERERNEELNWDEAMELIEWLRAISAAHGVTFFDVVERRMLLENDNGRHETN